jgi:hypothetical protein
MIRKTLLFAPIGLTVLALASGCGGAPTTSEDGPSGDELAASDKTAPQAAENQSKAAEDVGQTQSPWLGVPGFGAGFAYPGLGSGFGAPFYGGLGFGPFGVGMGGTWGWGSSMTCVNGFCY